MIDIHTHIYPRTYIELLKQNRGIPRITGEKPNEKFIMFAPSIINTLHKSKETGIPIGPNFYSLDNKLAFMDKFKIEISLISVGNPWLAFLDSLECRTWAQILNDELAELCLNYQDRFYGLGILPTNDLGATLDEIERIGKMNLRGVIMECRMLGGKTLDSSDLEPFWDKLEKTGVPLFLHPHFGVGMEELSGYGPSLPLSLGFTFETTLAATRIVYSGVFERHPNLKIILSHAGGTLPFLAGRIDAAWDLSNPKKIHKPPSINLKYFYYDSICYSTQALVATVSFTGPEKVLFGTDHPFGISRPATNIEAIMKANLTQRELDLIFRENAKNLFSL